MSCLGGEGMSWRIIMDFVLGTDLLLVGLCEVSSCLLHFLYKL